MSGDQQDTVLSIPREIADPRYALHDASLELAHVATGHWRAFRALGLDLAFVLEVARSWRAALGHVTHPWLCWNVDEEWCFVQQGLAKSVGWTPLVGFDPRVGPPRRVVDGAVVFDFNSRLGLPLLYPHFPLEFCFAFCERIAFWHSDLLVRPAKMATVADTFRALRNGETAASWVSPGLRHLFSSKRNRYWELIGCATSGASLDQFEKGCGWWMGFWAHPNCSSTDSELTKSRFYWDHGSGIYFWEKVKGGRVVVLPGKEYEEGHFTKIGHKNYVRSAPLNNNSDAERSMAEEIRRNFDLHDACRKMGLGHLLGM